MAEGGVVTRPTIALIGERGPEAIVPLHKSSEFGGGGINVNLNIGKIGSDLVGLPQHLQDNAVAAAVVAKLRASGGFRAIVRRQSRGL